jgi:hypothetical protein
MTQSFQSVSFNLSIDVTELSKRNASSLKFGYQTNGNFTQMDLMLHPGDNPVSLPIPANVLVIYTNGPSIQLTITWGSVSRNFIVNKYMHISDMTGVTAIAVANTYTGTPALAESVRAKLL